MIALNRRTKIFVSKEPTDMRASYDSLFSKVKSVLNQDPHSGHLFLFINSGRTSCKCLYYDGTGLVIISKRGEHQMRLHYEEENKRLLKMLDRSEQKSLLIEDQLVIIKSKIFGKSSEKSAIKSSVPKDPNKKIKKSRIQLPSLRYPNAPLVEKDIELAELPSCNACGNQMEDSGLTEDSEQLTTIPRQFSIVRFKRHKYRCGCCHGDLKTAPALPKIKEGSSYSDEMIIDVALSKLPLGTPVINSRGSNTVLKFLKMGKNRRLWITKVNLKLVIKALI